MTGKRVTSINHRLHSAHRATSTSLDNNTIPRKSHSTSPARLYFCGKLPTRLVAHDSEGVPAFAPLRLFHLTVLTSTHTAPKHRYQHDPRACDRWEATSPTLRIPVDLSCLFVRLSDLSKLLRSGRLPDLIGRLLLAVPFCICGVIQSVPHRKA